MRLSKVDKSLRDLHNSSYHMKADQYYCYNIIGDEISALIFEITKLPWQPFRTPQSQDGEEVLKCRE